MAIAFTIAGAVGSGFLLMMPGFNPVHGFMVNKVELELIFPRVSSIAPANHHFTIDSPIQATHYQIQ
jgi:hypothetical protein